MEKHLLSKSTFLRGVQCLKSLYLNKKRPFLRDRLSDAQRAVFKRGTDVGVLAWQLFPGGVDLKPRSPALYRKKAMETLEIVQSQKHPILYEATFQYDRLLAILDILVKSRNGWTAYEVKSSRGISETFLIDAAFQYYVITRAGVPLDDFYLVTVNPDYVLGDKLDVQQFFSQTSVWEEVKSRQAFIEEQIEKEKEALLFTSSPPVPIGLHCHKPYPCDFLGHCWKKVAENSLLYLDAFDQEMRFAQYYAGEDNPEAIDPAPLSDLQKIQLLSARQKEWVINSPALRAFMKTRMDKPVFLSLFAIRPAVPYPKGSRPYDLLPVAAAFHLPGDSRKIKYFIKEEYPARAFVSFLEALYAPGRQIVLYDQAEALELLKTHGTKEAMRRAEERVSGMKTLFQNGTLFHYRFRGDYSPVRTAQILFDGTPPHLNPSLLGMAWQRRVFERNFVFDDLEKETEAHLFALSDFTSRLANFLKNKV